MLLYQSCTPREGPGKESSGPGINFIFWEICGGIKPPVGRNNQSKTAKAKADATAGLYLLIVHKFDLE